MADFSELVGKTIVNINSSEGDAFIVFDCDDGSKYRLIHHQDCCESVSLIEGEEDLQSLVGHPVLLAEIRSCENPPQDESDDKYGIYQWTYYALASIGGNVDLRFYGASNGYYGVGVDFEKLEDVERTNYKTKEKYMAREWR